MSDARDRAINALCDKTASLICDECGCFLEFHDISTTCSVCIRAQTAPDPAEAMRETQAPR
jgi:hypothetical protein